MGGGGKKDLLGMVKHNAMPSNDSKKKGDSGSWSMSFDTKSNNEKKTMFGGNRGNNDDDRNLSTAVGNKLDFRR